MELVVKTAPMVLSLARWAFCLHAELALSFMELTADTTDLDRVEACDSAAEDLPVRACAFDLMPLT